MGDPEECPLSRPLLIPAVEELFNVRSGARIEGGGRLIEEEDCRFDRDRAEQCDDLAFSSQEVAGELLEEASSSPRPRSNARIRAARESLASMDREQERGSPVVVHTPLEYQLDKLFGYLATHVMGDRPKGGRFRRSRHLTVGEPRL